MMGLDLPARAAVLGLTCHELIELAERDARILAPAAVETPAGVHRLRRWLDAGQPATDPARLQFSGDDGVRAIVLEVIAALPAPTAWHASEHVSWVEVGRGTAAWAGFAPTRAPNHDQLHLIAINGRVADEELRGVIAHELGHSWHQAILESAPKFAAMPEREAVAARILFDKYTRATAAKPTNHAARWIRSKVANETLADRTAEAWGIRPGGPSELDLRRHFAAVYSEAEAIADKRDAEIEGATS